jgi:RNA polymerase sigma factor (sigma-70 family)
MASDDSVSGWLERLPDGDPDAARRLWERYFHRLVGLARQHLKGAAHPAGDEEDVALSAFASFCRGAEAGRFPELASRDGLWPLLVVLTLRKAWRLLRKEGRHPAPATLEEVLSREPDPRFAAEMAEQCEHLLRALDDEQLRRVALLRMEGWTVKEIAQEMGCSDKTVKRRLAVIRALWEKEAGP